MATKQSPNTKKKSVAATKKNQPGKTTRKIEKPKYKTFRLSRRIRHDAAPLPKARHIFSAAIKLLLRNKRLFAGILVIQLILTLLFVRGISLFASDLPDTKEFVQELFGDNSPLYTGVTVLGVLLTNSTSASTQVGSLYGSLLLLVGSLVIIWSLRQTHAKTQATVKEAYYKSMYPLVPLLLVLLVIALQLLPFAIGNYLYDLVVGGGIAVTGLEQFIWLVLYIGLALLSLYMLSSSLFAMYIVTLPDVSPMQALRSARELVLHRRLMIARKIVFLPVALLLIVAVIMLPIILYVTPIAEVVFFALSIKMFFVFHAYMYELYRELL